MPLLISDVVAPGTLSAVPQPVLEAGDSLLLRPWVPEDAPAVHLAFQDPVMHRWHARSTESVEEAAELVRGWIAGWQEERAASWAVTDAEGALVGRVALRTIDLFEGAGEMAYWMLSGVRGRGIAPRAVQALSRWAFDGPGLHRLFLRHSVHNPASCRVAEKSGFLFEGTERGSGLHADGPHDMHVHSRLAGDPDPGRVDAAA